MKLVIFVKKKYLLALPSEFSLLIWELKLLKGKSFPCPQANNCVTISLFPSEWHTKETTKFNSCNIFFCLLTHSCTCVAPSSSFFCDTFMMQHGLPLPRQHLPVNTKISNTWSFAIFHTLFLLIYWFSHRSLIRSFAHVNIFYMAKSFHALVLVFSHSLFLQFNCIDLRVKIVHAFNHSKCLR